MLRTAICNDQARPEPPIDVAKLCHILRRYGEKVTFWEDYCSESYASSVAVRKRVFILEHIRIQAKTGTWPHLPKCWLEMM